MAAGDSVATLRFFRSASELRAWLEKFHDKRDQLWLGFYRKSTGKPSYTWPELVDEVLCFGWIDGIRKSIDEESYAQRITPRRKGSIWSARNIERVAELTRAGRMHPAGLRVSEERDLRKQAIYSFENAPLPLSPEFEAAFRKNRKAWAFFETLPPFYRKTITYWVMSAKREETRQRRLATVIADSEAGRRSRDAGTKDEA